MTKQLEITEPKKNGLAKKEESGILTAPKETALGELHFDIDLAKKRDYLNEKLSMTPPKQWIKQHPLVKKKLADGTSVPAEYLPIERVEDLLRKIFQRFRIEIKESKILANALAVTVRVHYIDPVTGEWDYQDGAGATDIQTDQGKAAMDFMFTKSGAIQKAFPAAKSYAVKDATEVLGKIFGGSLNRADEISFSGAYDNRKPITEEELNDAKARAARMDLDIIDIVKKFFLVTDAQIAEIENAFPKQEN